MKKDVIESRPSRRKGAKLALARETVRLLTGRDLALVAAGVCTTNSDDTDLTTQETPICE